MTNMKKVKKLRNKLVSILGMAFNIMSPLEIEVERLRQDKGTFRHSRKSK